MWRSADGQKLGQRTQVQSSDATGLEARSGFPCLLHGYMAGFITENYHYTRPSLA